VGLIHMQGTRTVRPARRRTDHYSRLDRGSSPGISIEAFAPRYGFLPWRRRQTDAFICMYHDQGHIPLKALAFDSAINTTLGLPVIRTSVDHGTAFDIAWQGKANPNSLFEAVRLAARLAFPDDS